MIVRASVRVRELVLNVFEVTRFIFSIFKLHCISAGSLMDDDWKQRCFWNTPEGRESIRQVDIQQEDEDKRRAGETGRKCQSHEKLSEISSSLDLFHPFSAANLGGGVTHLRLCLWVGLPGTTTQIPQKSERLLCDLYPYEIRVLAGKSSERQILKLCTVVFYSCHVCIYSIHHLKCVFSCDILLYNFAFPYFVNWLFYCSCSLLFQFQKICTTKPF